MAKKERKRYGFPLNFELKAHECSARQRQSGGYIPPTIQKSRQPVGRTVSERR